jgi:hypothetical protein
MPYEPPAAGRGGEAAALMIVKNVVTGQLSPILAFGAIGGVRVGRMGASLAGLAVAEVWCGARAGPRVDGMAGGRRGRGPLAAVRRSRGCGGGA